VSHTYTKLLIHAVFSTKDRRPLIHTSFQSRLYAYIAGILKNNDCFLVRAGGVADHIHLLFALNPTMAVAEIMRLVKTNSSKWLHETFPDAGAFAWQNGYSAFSVSRSSEEAVVAYIEGQEEHHRRLTFQEELRALLEKHGIEYDERHIWE